MLQGLAARLLGTVARAHAATPHDSMRPGAATREGERGGSRAGEADGSAKSAEDRGVHGEGERFTTTEGTEKAEDRERKE